MRADVRASAASDLIAMAGSANDGTFSFLGLETGRVILQASLRGAQSEPVPYDVTETPGPLVRLVVLASTEVKGWVQTQRGDPVAGALVRAFHPAFGITEAVSGPSGEFKLQIPKAAGQLDVSVIVPSFPAKLLRIVGGASPQPIGIVVGSVAARLRVLRAPGDPWPFVRRDAGDIVPFGLLLQPNPGSLPRGVSADAIVADVESGLYSVCADAAARNCETAELAPGAQAVIDLRKLLGQKDAR